MSATTLLWVLGIANGCVLLYFVARLGWIAATRRPPQSWRWLVVGFVVSLFGTGWTAGVLWL